MQRSRLNRAIARLESLLNQARSSGNYAAYQGYLQGHMFLKHLSAQLPKFTQLIEQEIRRSSREAIKKRRSPHFVFHGKESKQGKPFAELKESTLRHRKRGASFILRETSQMFHTLKIKINERGEIVATSGHRIKKGNLIDHHSFGAEKGKWKMESRPFVGMDRKGAYRLKRKLIAFFRSLMRNYGR